MLSRLTEIKDLGSDKRRNKLALYRCNCGKEVTVIKARVLRGATKSCGCLQKEIAAITNKAFKTTHGESRKSSVEYTAWSEMRKRCNNKATHSYSNYGGRGIVICERWTKFENFLSDMGRRPNSTYSLDRINVNGNYEPSNCRWATTIEQNKNRRNCYITANRLQELLDKERLLDNYFQMFGALSKDA